MDEDNQQSFLTSLPGILTGLAALVTAAAGGYGILSKSREGQSKDVAAQEAVPLQPKAVAAQEEDPVAPGKTAGKKFNLVARIKDVDGYVNVREDKSKDSLSKAKLLSNQTVHTHRQPGNWWEVRTADGTEGFIYRDRLDIIDE